MLMRHARTRRSSTHCSPTGPLLGASALLGVRHSSGNRLTGGNVAFRDAQGTRRRRATGPVWDEERCVCAAGSAAEIVEIREQRRAHGRAVEPAPLVVGRAGACMVWSGAWVVKRSGIGDFGGSSLEPPRPWQGSKWPGPILGVPSCPGPPGAR